MGQNVKIGSWKKMDMLEKERNMSERKKIAGRYRL